MSVAVVVKKDKKIVIASDSRVSFGDTVVPTDNHKASKIRKIGNSYIAKTGWAIYENIFDDLLKSKQVPSLLNKNTIYSFFIKLWKKLHEKYAFMNDQCNEKDSPFGDLDSSFLIANKNGIFYVASDMSVSEFEQFYAIGSGDDYALGALYALYNEKYNACQLAKKAIETAIAFKPYCGGDIEIIEVN
ncbi:MAG: hypothetical protein GY795_12915 [Desulfobacterales bacterium]|nr:hypothetical protein [Desulfobacterales bacterium]